MNKRRNPHGTSDLTRSQALQLLGLDAGASPLQAKAAFRAAAKQHHPDVGGDAEMFKKMAEAYEVLTGKLQPRPEQPRRPAWEEEYDPWSTPAPAPEPRRKPVVRRASGTVEGPTLEMAIDQLVALAQRFAQPAWHRLKIRVIARSGPYLVSLDELLFDARSGRDILSGPAPAPPRSAWDEE